MYRAGNFHSYIGMNIYVGLRKYPLRSTYTENEFLSHDVARHEATPIRKISIAVARCRAMSSDIIFIVRVHKAIDVSLALV
jgi:DNA polymerase/3'-5' exonuclease PolX